MLYKTLIGLMLCSLASLTPPAHAGLTVSLSSPSDLSALTVGQKVEIDVSISGLPSPNNTTDFVFNLNTKVLFSSSLFQAVPDPNSSSGLTATVATGSVFNNNVQGPLQIANFQAQSSLVAGAAIGIFSESPNTNSGAIGLNGLYYSFILQAKSVGSGTIAFDPTAGANEYAANDTGFNYAPLPNTGALAFNIKPATVPEPSSIVLCGMAGLFVAVAARRHRRLVARDRRGD